MNTPANDLLSLGHALDLPAQGFGELQRSNEVAHHVLPFHARMGEAGYLYLHGFPDVREALAVDVRRQ